MKRYVNTALVYAILAMIGGVFYREFTKMLDFTARTSLGLVHTHYFMLGMVFFLLLAVVEKSFSFTTPKTGRVLGGVPSGPQPHRRHAGGAGDHPGDGHHPVRRRSRGSVGHRRPGPHPAGGGPGAGAAADPPRRRQTVTPRGRKTKLTTVPFRAAVLVNR